MKSRFVIIFISLATVLAIAFACNKDRTVASSPDYSFSEEFDTVSNSVSRGWIIANNSKPIGTASWKQGIFYYENKTGSSDGFSALNASYSGTDFIMTSSDCGHGKANCSNWLISPPFTIKNEDVISFYTRTFENPATAPDRLQVRLNEVNSSADVGVDSNSVGNFSKVLLEINPSLLLSGPGSYPGIWTEYRVAISDIPVAKKTRLAFRYYIPDGGPIGKNGLAVGIDRFKFESR